MDVFAGVHVETRVEEGAVAEALVCVLVDDATEETHVTKSSSFMHIHVIHNLKLK